MNMKKIAAVLTAAVTFTSLTIPAFAEDPLKDETTGLYYTINGDNAEIVYSWGQQYNAAGEFIVPDTIDGKTVTAFDWRVVAYNPNVTKVTIGPNLTVINSAFIDDGHAENLAEIKVDGSNASFCSVDNVLYSKDKTKLIKSAPTKTSVTIDAAVTEIGARAFKNSHISSVTIPDGVTTIGQYAFDGCKNLTTLNIPASVTSLDDAIAQDSGVTEITVAAGNTAVKSVDGVLFSADGEKLLQYPPKKAAADFVIPEGTLTFTSNAFTGASINKLTIPASVTGFHAAVFSNFEELGSVAYAGTVEQWGNLEFSTADYRGTYKPQDIECSDGTLYGVNLGGASQPTDSTAAANGVQCSFAADAFTSAVNFVRDAIALTASRFDVDISFTDAGGNKLQPTKPVTVRIPLPAAMKGQTVYVYHTNDSGTLEDVDSTVKTVGGVEYVEFTASSFSVYTLSLTVLTGGEGGGSGSSGSSSGSSSAGHLVVSTNDPSTGESTDVSQAKPEETTAQSPSTGDDKNQNTGVVLAVIPAALAAAGVIVSKRRK